MASSASKTDDKPQNVGVTDVHYKGGPMGGQHRRFVGEEPDAEVQTHGGSYRLDRAESGATSYLWDADEDRPVTHATDGDEASTALGSDGAVMVDETAGVRTDGPSTSPAIAVKGSGTSSESNAQRRDNAKTGGARPASAEDKVDESTSPRTKTTK